MHPINGTAKAIIQRLDEIDLKVPKNRISVIFEQFFIQLSDLQYRDLLRVTEYLSNYSQVDEFHGLRPKHPPSNVETRKSWWTYAVESARRSARKDLFTWEQVEQRKKDRLTYIELYKRSKGAAWLPKLEGYDLDRFNGLERKLDYESIVAFRDLADTEFAAEAAKHNEVVKSKKSSWWFFGSSTVC